MVFLLHSSAIYQQKLQYQPKLTTNTSQNMSTVKLLFSVSDTHCFNLYRENAEKNWFCITLKYHSKILCIIHVFFPFSFQKQAMLVRQLEEEVVKTRQHAKETNPEIKAHIESLQLENDHLTREVAILKETIKVRILRYVILLGPNHLLLWWQISIKT